MMMIIIIMVAFALPILPVPIIYINTTPVHHAGFRDIKRSEWWWESSENNAYVVRRRSSGRRTIHAEVAELYGRKVERQISEFKRARVCNRNNNNINKILTHIYIILYYINFIFVVSVVYFMNMFKCYSIIIYFFYRQ